MCVLACVLHVGDRFRCWKKMLCGMKFSVIAIYHTVGLGCEGTLLNSFFFYKKRGKVFPHRLVEVGECAGYKELV